ncbi:GntR family transcriptional regulator/MocR family aminotransferase [Stackebrandtia albiflava]|uniref:GntR family transcriptional regulator/MocR family aminotransferase n=1 Tax=Stackebrandtia albiflava TaxID=406432 RepID=A0A562UYC7_9ACTN|nr:PLP-dependent aminotransferase family protein [Stackebrandtia albiflava]TWJ10615.1 GntR family transcriptional regulator/MocR family aminotransferase [Stackebrandtia albiflava]
MTDLPIRLTPGGKDSARRLGDQLREAVRSGRLAVGFRLPASRVLAADLGVARGVVVSAYQQLTAEGVFAARSGAGTWVAHRAVAAPATPPARVRAADARFDLRVGTPDLSAFPRRQWLAAVRRVVSALPHSRLGYPDPQGLPDLRDALAAQLRRVRFADTDPSRVSVVGGVAHGLHLVVRALHGPRLAVEDPTSPGQLPLLREAGATVIPIPVDAEGMDVAALERSDATAVLLTPAHQYPTGAVLSPRRRAALRAWLDRPGRFAVEDDYDAEFRYDREPVGCLQGLLPDRTALLGSVSKSLAPGLRLGWVVAPGHVTAEVVRIRRRTDLGDSVFDQAVLAELLRHGDYDRHVRWARRRYRERRDRLVAALTERLPEAEVTGVAAGLHLQVEIPGVDEAALVAAAAARSVAVRGSADFRIAGSGPSGLVLGFGGIAERHVEAAVAALAAAVADVGGPVAARRPVPTEPVRGPGSAALAGVDTADTTAAVHPTAVVADPVVDAGGGGALGNQAVQYPVGEPVHSRHDGLPSW